MMHRPQHNTTRLPARLLQELGHSGDQKGKNGDKKKGLSYRRNGPVGRKERRKLERAQKKRGVIPRAKASRQRTPEISDEEELDVDSENDEEAVAKRMVEKPASNTSQIATAPLKGILKNSAFPPSSSSRQDEVRSAGTIPKASRSAVNKLAEDDEEIKALEKLLGVKGKRKLPKSFEDDGLDELLDGLEGGASDEEENTDERKRKDEAWLGRKRQDVEALEDGNINSETGSADELDCEEKDDNDVDDELSDLESASSESSFSGFESDKSSQAPLPTRIRENPYIAPVAPSQAKYLPPSLRVPPSSETESLTRLRRQLLGLMNRLSEANLLSMLSELEKLYASNPRQHVTSTLSSLLLDLVCDPTALNETFIILQAGFISSIYKVIGTDFGAYMLSQIVLKFDSLFPDASMQLTNKGPLNLISLLSSLYTLSMTTSHLLFAYVRQFLATLTDAHTEFILKIILSCGPDLRRSDPSSLKSIVLLLQSAITAAGGESGLPVRTKFMIETITALKNNRMRTGVAASAITAEHTTRMRKILGSLNDGRRTVRSTEPLNLSLDDVRNTEKRGKWWLVGSSWHPSAQPEPEEMDSVHAKQNGDSDTDPEADAVAVRRLASQNHMSTPSRSLLFTTLLSAPNYHSAAQTLSNVPLKKNVFRTEMPRVLLQCVGAEEIYNPYYALVARRLCELDRRVRVNIQFAIWDFLKRFGDSEDDDGDEIESGSAVSMRKIVNTAKFVSGILLSRALGLGDVLRPVDDLRYLRRGGNTATFVEVLLVTVILQSQLKEKGKRKIMNDSALSSAFTLEAKEEEQGLKEGLKWFLKNVIKKSDLVEKASQEKERLASGCGIALHALARMETMRNDSDSMDEETDDPS